MNKKALTEADIRTKFITPALVGVDGEKWDVMTQVREEAYFTKGRVIVRGKIVKRGEARKADYLLLWPRTGADATRISCGIDAAEGLLAAAASKLEAAA